MKPELGAETQISDSHHAALPAKADCEEGSVHCGDLPVWAC